MLSSERGFLELAGRDDGLPLREAFLRFRDLVSADMDWVDSRKARFRFRASCAKVARGGDRGRQATSAPS